MSHSVSIKEKLSKQVKEINSLSNTLGMSYLSNAESRQLLSYGFSRLMRREDAFRLFRNINSDFIRGWRAMGRVSLGAEVFTNSATAWGIYQLSKETE